MDVIMKAFHKKRLMKLVELLQRIEPEKFDIDQWMSTDFDSLYNDKSPSTKKPVKAEECGSAGCGMGWATTIPSFRKAGLLLFRNVSTYDRTVISRGCQVVLTDLKTKKPIASEYEAAALFFGLDFDQAMAIFHPNGYPRDKITTPMMVSRKIRKLLGNPDLWKNGQRWYHRSHHRSHI
jgi:hypothetical protein